MTTIYDEFECQERGRQRLTRIFPNSSPRQWEARPHGLWRRRYDSGSLFIRDQLEYVALRGDQHIKMQVAAEIIRFAEADTEADIRAEFDRAGPW